MLVQGSSPLAEGQEAHVERRREKSEGGDEDSIAASLLGAEAPELMAEGMREWAARRSRRSGKGRLRRLRDVGLEHTRALCVYA